MIFPDWVATMNARKDRALKRIESNKQILFDLFDIKNVGTAGVRFQGEGDSGGIDSVTLFRKDGDAFDETDPIFDTLIPNARILDCIEYSQQGEKDILSSEPTSLRTLIEGICYDILMAEHTGWENNDGAYGSFEFDSESRIISLEFYERSTQLIEHEF